MTQEDLADVLQVGGMSVSKWERGVSTPPLARLAEIARALGVPAGWLVDGDVERVPDEPPGFERPRLRGRRYRSANVEGALDALDIAERHLAKLREEIEGGRWHLAAADLGLALGRLSAIGSYLVAESARPMLANRESAPAVEITPSTKAGPESEATP